VNSVPYKPYIAEDDDVKILHFDSIYIQSEMRKDAPHELTLGYTQAMMGFLLLHPRPLDILIIGLGGGSLSKFCHHHLPEARVTTVEISWEVIALRNLFCIPDDSERFQVIYADAIEYMRHKTNIADVILLDGYDDFGLPKGLCNTRFYAHCKRALRENGILVANLHSENSHANTYIQRMKQVFNDQILLSSSLTSTNQIAFALKNTSPQSLEILQNRATALRQQTGLPFQRYLEQMWSSASFSNGQNWLETGFELEDHDQPDMGCSMISI
jgi:spermidine synthase